MIIKCENCSRKFIVKDKDIPKKAGQFSVAFVLLLGIKYLLLVVEPVN